MSWAWGSGSDTEAQWAVVAVRERLLLLIAASFIAITYLALILARQHNPLRAAPAVIWVGCAVAGHYMLGRHLPHRDPLLFPLAMLISGWGLILITRLEPFFAARQAVWLVIAVGAMVTVVLSPRHLLWLSRYRYLWLLGGLGLLALTVVVGSNPSGVGPRLWLGAADVFIQPSELLKVILVAFLASYITDHRSRLDSHALQLGPLRLPSLGFLVPLLLMWGFCVVLLLWQRDLGTATLFFVVFIVMLYLASGRAVYLLGGVGMLVAVGTIAYWRLGVVQQRIDIWLNPWPEANDRAYQIVQSLMAFAAGGVLGEGVGQGSPAYIPVVHSDFVFAALTEEWGLLGACLLTVCIALLVMRGLRLAVLLQAHPFRSLLAAGVSIMLAVQSLLIMGGTLKLIPLTGVTLPFLSYGGSSLLASFLMLGLLLVLSEPS
jgi:cell division protein FtsW (lipid II flippase)